MRVAELRNKNIVIWGLGREAKAATDMVRAAYPDIALTFVNEGAGDKSFLRTSDVCFHDEADIRNVLHRADVIIKSPGVSLYHPLLRNARAPITSLLNLWLAEPHKFRTIAVTGTKGKSTTSALLAHLLNALGMPTALLGNIGVPVTEAETDKIACAIIETSSYQAANISEYIDIGLVTALFPEHLDWHQDLQTYYRDKLNLLAHSHSAIISQQACDTARANGITCGNAVLFAGTDGFHIRDGQIYDGAIALGKPPNAHLARAHNLGNVCGVLTVLRVLGYDARAALPLLADFHGLPHRQQELSTHGDLLFVDDSISTTPQSAIAAMESYAGRPITLLAGGFDRGIPYDTLCDYVTQHNIHSVICMGPSGARIHAALAAKNKNNLFNVITLDDAVRTAISVTPRRGVVLLSPAAPSYGMFKNFEERGQAFSALVEAMTSQTKILE